MSTDGAVSSASPASVTTYRAVAVRGIAFALAGVGFAAVMATHLIDFGSDGLRVQLLDANSDSSWSHRLVAAILVTATAIAAVGGWRAHHPRRLWMTTAAILAFLSVDELSPLHQSVDQMAWGKALYAPILLILAIGVLRLAGRGGQALILRVGLVTLFVSFGIHVLGPHLVHALGYGTDSWPYQFKVGLKQGTELAGWLLLLLGLRSLVFGNGLRG